MILNPQMLVDKGVVTLSEYSKVQQNGIDLTLREYVSLEPGTSINILLCEKVSLPETMCAELKIRSTYSRQSIFLSSGLWDSGFVGNLGCTLYNLGSERIVLAAGERICQLVTYEAASASLYNGQYQNT